MKKATLISFILFVGAFMALAFFSPAQTPRAINTAIQTAKGKISSGPILTTTEVAKHNTPSDCYLIVNGAVYDVTSYIGEHPGGMRNITSRCGQESTKIFAAIHSNFAWNLLKKFYVGDLGKSSTIAGGTAVINTQAPEELASIKQTLQAIYPKAEIVDVKPRLDFFVAKIIKDNALYEVHIDKSGTILKEEVQNDEVDWSAWNEDSDD